MQHFLRRLEISWSKLENEIIPSIISENNGIKLRISKRKSGKFTNTWKLNNISISAIVQYLNNQ